MSRLRCAALFGFLLGALALPAWRTAQAGEGGTQYAFLVGCGRYEPADFRALPYTGNVVLGFRDALRATGFDDDHITVLHDGATERRYHPTRQAILVELDLLLDGMRPEDTLVVALSGHGLQFKNDPVSYFVPVDGKASDRKTLLPLNGPGGLYEKLKSCKAQKKLLLVNACRNDPAVSLDFAAERLDVVDEDREDEVPDGIAAIYSCSAGQKSYYDPDRKIALFYEHVIKAWKGEYSRGEAVTLEAFFAQVRDKTRTDANRRLRVKQTPVIQREFKGDWVIAKAAVVPPVPPVPQAPPKVKLPPAKADTGIIAKMRFVPIPKGTFWMGWDSENKQSKQETIDHDFELAAYCVTQGQWQEVMGNNPSYFSREGEGMDKVKDIRDEELARFPVERVSWEDAQEFVKKVTQEAGNGWTYRLPRDAEWEYARRNAAQSQEECAFDFYFHKGTNDLSSAQANFNGNYPGGNGAKGPYLGRPTKVGSYAPNKLGLYDMHGNVWQWCEDLYDNTRPDRVVRGGCWNDGSRFCRAAVRYGLAPSYRKNGLGFRLARVRVGG